MLPIGWSLCASVSLLVGSGTGCCAPCRPSSSLLPRTHKQLKEPISVPAFKRKASPSLWALSLLSCSCCRLCSTPKPIALDQAECKSYRFPGQISAHVSLVSTVLLLCNSHIPRACKFPNSFLVPDSRVVCVGVFRAWNNCFECSSWSLGFIALCDNVVSLNMAVQVSANNTAGGCLGLIPKWHLICL